MTGDHPCVFCGALRSECDRRIGGKANCCVQCKEYGRQVGHLPPLEDLFAPEPMFRVELTQRELATLKAMVNPMAQLMRAYGASEDVDTLVDKVNGAERI